MAAIPSYVIEYFLLSLTRKGNAERYTQDGGIVLNIWLAFAKDLYAPQRVLITPLDRVSTAEAGAALHHAILLYRKTKAAKGGRYPKQRRSPNVSPLENFVAATVYFDELLRVVLPLTTWWRDKNLNVLQQSAGVKRGNLRDLLAQAIRIRLGHEEDSIADLKTRLKKSTAQPDYKVLDAASIAALIGLFRAVDEDPELAKDAPDPRKKTKHAHDDFLEWVRKKASKIAQEATEELRGMLDIDVFERARTMPGAKLDKRDVKSAPALIHRVYLDRVGQVAAADANETIKADAAIRLFDISCTDVTWAVIDAGVSAAHPAFREHLPGRTAEDPPVSRVRETIDFTQIHLIRNFDLVELEEGDPDRKKRLIEVAAKLDPFPQKSPESREYRKMALERLDQIAKQLSLNIQPDWALIEPLIRLRGASGERKLFSDHGTHVAGIIGGDWRSEEDEKEIVFQGVCPDINLYDLRVVEERSLEATEFALVAAIEYVQYVNQRAGSNGPLIHGVNVSLSIPHEVRNYGCGATPVCVACDRLSSSGVVVVAAAGNRGWNEQEMGFGTFIFCSITDPGNAQQVITVGATHRSNPHTYGVSYFSSRGPTGDGRVKPDLVAPGEKIRGPIRGSSDDLLDGTSMAAPFVSGASALLLARHRELIGNAARVKEILCQSATDLGREKYFQGHGLVNVLRALQSI
jgi:subtilisin family serine protease